MTLTFIRVFFLIISTFVGLYLGTDYYNPLMGGGVGFLAGVALILLEMSLKRVSVRGLSSMVFGLLLGVFMAKLIADILSLLPLGEYVQSLSRVILTIVFSYLGAVMALRGKNEFHLIIPYVRFKRQEIDEEMILLDTSSIIDGRVLDLYKTNFLSGHLIVPKFILQELQSLADSENHLKRRKGKRGLEILRKMQKDSSVVIRIVEEDIPGVDDVDGKLVRLAKILGGCIFTVDYNLIHVAAIQGVETLNINELAEAVKPAAFPEDEMELKLVREGKEQDQAVAFLDDGTMVVVSDARKYIGKTVKVFIASTIQTQAGRIIFAKLKNGKGNGN